MNEQQKVRIRKEKVNIWAEKEQKELIKKSQRLIYSKSYFLN